MINLIDKLPYREYINYILILTIDIYRRCEKRMNITGVSRRRATVSLNPA